MSEGPFHTQTHTTDTKCTHRVALRCTAVEAIAVMVILPMILAVILAFGSTWAPAFAHWRECVARNPTFPPSAWDFFVLGQTTSLPGHEALTVPIPPDIEKMLEHAEEDMEAEVLAASVNADLTHVISEARHLAAALYATGEVRLDDGHAEGTAAFPPKPMRVAFHDFTKKLCEYALIPYPTNDLRHCLPLLSHSTCPTLTQPSQIPPVIVGHDLRLSCPRAHEGTPTHLLAVRCKSA